MTTSALRLGVNIDHVATLRQARNTPYPDLLAAARACEQAGADGITIHLREDRRHIQDADVYRLHRELRIPMNLEMADAPEIVAIACDVRPAEVCLVPEKRQELTTEGGLDVQAHAQSLRSTIARLRDAKMMVSLFVDPDPEQLAASADLGATVVELHTGTFCDAPDPTTAQTELQRLVDGARAAHALGLRVNAGHGIALPHIPDILRIPHLHALNIGHSIVCHAVMVGLEQAVREMRAAMAPYQRANEPPAETA